MTVVSVASRRCEHTGQSGGILAGLRGCFQRDAQRQLDDTAGAPPLGGRQDRRHRKHRRSRAISLSARKHRRGFGPIGQPRPQDSEAADVGIQPHPARPRIKLQLVPPKPKELDRTRLTGARRFSRI
jgi:hypothetical protein